MNIKFIVAKHDENIFNTYILPSMQRIPSQLIQLTDNPGVATKDSLFKKYNVGIEGASQVGFEDDDVFVFVHEDIRIVDNHFADKLKMIFQQRADIGLLGIAGTEELTENCAWWQSANEKMRGHVFQERLNNEVKHLVWGDGIGFFDNMVMVDGCIMAIRGKLIKSGLRFDDITYNSFHFYDADICLSVLEHGYKIAVADILVQHKSMGMGSTEEDWAKSKDKFMSKWKSKGKTFPITNSQFKQNEIDQKSSVIEIDI